MSGGVESESEDPFELLKVTRERNEMIIVDES